MSNIFRHIGVNKDDVVVEKVLRGDTAMFEILIKTYPADPVNPVSIVPLLIYIIYFAWFPLLTFLYLRRLRRGLAAPFIHRPS
jgi:hypothetical protein